MDLKEFEERVEELENRQKQIRKTSKAILDSFALHIKSMEKIKVHGRIYIFND